MLSALMKWWNLDYSDCSVFEQLNILILLRDWLFIENGNCLKLVVNSNETYKALMKIRFKYQGTLAPSLPPVASFRNFILNSKLLPVLEIFF